MTDTNKPELIEEAAKAIGEVTYTTSNDQVRAARAALAVFEQAHTPTRSIRECTICGEKVTESNATDVWAKRHEHDDEREARQALDVLHRYAFGSNEIGRSQVANMVEIIFDHLRRTAVQEPHEPQHDDSCADWCNHCQVCGKGILYGSRCPDHYLNQPQGEPSDAEVHAGAVAIDPAAWEPGIFYWQASSARDNSLELARAALRAAYETRGEGR